MKKHFITTICLLIAFGGLIALPSISFAQDGYTSIDDENHRIDSTGAIEEHTWATDTNNAKFVDWYSHAVTKTCAYCGLSSWAEESHEIVFSGSDGEEYTFEDNDLHARWGYCEKCKSKVPEYEGHNFDAVDWKYVNKNYHSTIYECIDCGGKITEKEKHEWDEWDVTKKATLFKQGKKERMCIDCGKIQTKTIDKIKAFAKFKKKSYTVVAGKVLKMKNSLKMHTGDKVKKWKVSNSKIASITKSGQIKAKKKGTIKVTAILKSGKKATCTVKVKAPKKAAAKKKKASKKRSSGGGGTVYWTPSGSVYHRSSNCRTLKRSKTIYSGTPSDSGLSRCCKVCG